MSIGLLVNCRILASACAPLVCETLPLNNLHRVAVSQPLATQLGMMRRATSEDFPGTEFSTVVVSRT